MLNLCCVVLLLAISYGATAGSSPDTSDKTALIAATTPEPKRFVVRGTELIDRVTTNTAFFRGIG